MSKRQIIVTAVNTAMAAITTVGGYNNDIAAVLEWLDEPLKEDLSQLPAVIVRDTDEVIGTVETEGNEGEELAEHTLYFDIIVIGASGSNTPAHVRTLIEDVVTAFSTLDIKTLEILSGSFLSSEMETEKLKKRIGAALVRFFVRYKTLAWSY
jgi:uncharacterized protein (UPF0147 family)